MFVELQKVRIKCSDIVCTVKFARLYPVEIFVCTASVRSFYIVLLPHCIAAVRSMFRLTRTLMSLAGLEK